MSDTHESTAHPSATRLKKYEPAVGPRLQKLLGLVFGLFSILIVNSTYLVAVTMAQSFTGKTFENYFYQYMFLLHLVLGLVFIAPVVVFGILHIRNAHARPNRRAVRAGYALFTTTLVLIGSGIVLTRIPGTFEITDPTVHSTAYWFHVLSPLVLGWLFVLHRLAGKRIRWKVGIRWAVVAGVFALVMVGLHSRDPRQWNVIGNPEGVRYFFPSLARTLSGDFIPADVLRNDAYCQKCHQDVHEGWLSSAHRFSSFNNPVYLLSVKETREVALERDGNVNASRFCAGCHDPVPFFSGAFNDPDYDLERDPTASAGITCTVCHSITNVNSPRGNSDYTIDEPIHYPFTGSESPALAWVNELLIKAKPGFHKKTFLKPLHQTTEFCGSCHKVHLPEELNDYKWLRGQNHYDSFWLSGVSGQGVASFYYPEVAEQNCNNCHMPKIPSEDFSARVRDDSGERKTLDHQFPSANTAVPLFGQERGDLTAEQVERAQRNHRDFLSGKVRVDLFGIKSGGEQGAEIDSPLIAPLRPEVPSLTPGGSYLLEVVIRTLKLGHLLTEGTADSNELWLDVEARSGGRIIGRSGGLRESDLAVDPWSHFVNAFVLDREGRRINRRNAQDIFTPLYSHQIPPGAADVGHYLLELPADLSAPVEVTARLRYRKFDAEIMRLARDDPEHRNDLPIVTLAEDRIVFPLASSDALPTLNGPVEFPEWQRWNDYGIALLRKGQKGELRQAEHAFRQVEKLGRPDGPLNLARVYIKEGRVTRDAPEALRRAGAFEPKAPEWTVLWLSGVVNEQNGAIDEAIADYEQILEGGFAQAAGRGFDFSKDYRLLNALGGACFSRAKQERGEAGRAEQERLLRRAVSHFEKALGYDPENRTAHYNLKQIHALLGDSERAAEHARLHARYQLDDNARDQAVATARRRYPAADQAANEIVIYDLHRPGAYELPAGASRERR